MNVKPTGLASPDATRTALKPPARAGPVPWPLRPAIEMASDSATDAARIPIFRMSSAPSDASIGAVATAPPSMFGVPALRSEDPRFLRGEGRYLDNVEIPGALHAVFVRSIMPHARVDGLDVTGCLASPGVVGAYTARIWSWLPCRRPAPSRVTRTASSRGCSVGSPSRTTSCGSSGRSSPSWSRRPSARRSTPRSSPPWSTSRSRPWWTRRRRWRTVRRCSGRSSVRNVAHAFGATGPDDPLAGADVVVRGRFVNQRVAPAPMETNGIAVVPEEDGSFTVWVSTQIPFDVRDDLAETLGVGRDRVRAIAPDVGGAFGAKLQVYAEYHAVAAIAARLGRPVRWQETRSESMVSLTHGRAQVQTVELGATRDGTLVGLRAELLADMGAYPIGAFMPGTTQEMLSGVYRIPRIVSSGRSVVTNYDPGGARTVGRAGPRRRPSSNARWTCWPPSSGSIPSTSDGRT